MATIASAQVDLVRVDDGTISEEEKQAMIDEVSGGVDAVADSQAALAETVDTLTDTLEASNGKIDALETSRATQAQSIITINGSITNIKSGQSAIASKVATAETGLAAYKEKIPLDTVTDDAGDSVPSITLAADASGNENRSQQITKSKISFLKGGSETAYISGDTFVAPNMQTTQLYMRGKNNAGEMVGGLGWVSRVNGHLSLKQLVGGE